MYFHKTTAAINSNIAITKYIFGGISLLPEVKIGKRVIVQYTDSQFKNVVAGTKEGFMISGMYSQTIGLKEIEKTRL